MADFRKLVLVLAVLAIVAAPASAQLACTVSANPTQLRSEGLTERVGDTTFDCTNTGPNIVSITAVYSAIVTNHIFTSGEAFPGKIDAYLLVNGEAIAGVLRPDGHTVVWENITVPQFTGPGTLGITNVRVNAAAIGTGPVGSVADVTETIVVSGSDVVSVPDNVVTVGSIFNGLTFSTTETPVSLQACLAHNDVSDTEGLVTDFTLDFAEGFASAFKQLTPTPPAEGVAGQSGEQNLLLNTLEVAQYVTNPTQLRAVFTNVPSGVKVYVTANNLTTENPITTAFVEAGGSTVDTGFQQVTVIDGTGTAVWDIVSGANESISQTVSFGVAVSFAAYAPTLPAVSGVTSATTVIGTFAPISDVGIASTTAEVPRFVAGSVVPEDAFTVSACVTNLLFPFVSNVAGFDTGIALVNTSTDNATGSTPPANQPFDTTAQTGTCTLYYFGVKSDGTVPAPQTTVPIGKDTTSTEPINQYMVAFALSQGGPAGATGSVASFNGYIIARCNFQYGHGYAFITDLGAQKLAQGYLALVIPDVSPRAAQPFSVNTTAVGEILGF